jgi:cytochrome d ubiquinol oxidase subunit II
MTTVDLVAIVLWLGVTAYAVFGGADFGGGFWHLAAGTGPQAHGPRNLIADAIGPVWEANHTWLIFDLVILWTAFPPAFAAIMSTLFVPLSLAAFGIVLRGAAFAFGPLSGGERGRRTADLVFGLSSIASGRVPVGGTPGDPFGSWLTLTSALVGVLAIAVCGYLAAVFLVADARRFDQPELERYFLRRASAAAIVAGALAVAGIGVLQMDAPILAQEITRVGWPFILASGVFGLVALLRIRLGASGGTRALAVGAVVAIIWGWGVAQYPDILPGTMTLAEAAAPAGSLDALLVIFVVAALVIAPSLALLYYLDQASRLGGHGAATSPQGDRPADDGR